MRLCQKEAPSLRTNWKLFDNTLWDLFQCLRFRPEVGIFRLLEPQERLDKQLG